MTTKKPYPFETETVPLGHVWVEGEHPESERFSRDSNFYGPVSAFTSGTLKSCTESVPLDFKKFVDRTGEGRDLAFQEGGKNTMGRSSTKL